MIEFFKLYNPLLPRKNRARHLSNHKVIQQRTIQQEFKARLIFIRDAISAWKLGSHAAWVVWAKIKLAAALISAKAALTLSWIHSGSVYGTHEELLHNDPSMLSIEKQTATLTDDEMDVNCAGGKLNVVRHSVELRVHALISLVNAAWTFLTRLAAVVYSGIAIQENRFAKFLLGPNIKIVWHTNWDETLCRSPFHKQLTTLRAVRRKMPSNSRVHFECTSTLGGWAFRGAFPCSGQSF